MHKAPILLKWSDVLCVHIVNNLEEPILKP